MKRIKLPDYAKLPLALIGCFIAYKIIKKGKDTANDIADALSNSVTAAAVQSACNAYGVSPVRLRACTSVAERIYDAFYKQLFGMVEDEAAAAAAFNELYGQGEAIVTAVIYKAAFKKSLYGDIESYCHGPAFSKFRTLLLNAIKNV
jgi:hypothetical protein